MIEQIKRLIINKIRKNFSNGNQDRTLTFYDDNYKYLDIGISTYFGKKNKIYLFTPNNILPISGTNFNLKTTREKALKQSLTNKLAPVFEEKVLNKLLETETNYDDYFKEINIPIDTDFYNKLLEGYGLTEEYVNSLPDSFFKGITRENAIKSLKKQWYRIDYLYYFKINNKEYFIFIELDGDCHSGFNTLLDNIKDMYFKYKFPFLNLYRVKSFSNSISDINLQINNIKLQKINNVENECYNNYELLEKEIFRNIFRIIEKNCSFKIDILNEILKKYSMSEIETIIKQKTNFKINFKNENHVIFPGGWITDYF